MSFASVPDLLLEPLIRSALMEDMGSYGDVTTRSIIPETTNCCAELVARENAVVSGMQVATIAFRLIDPNLEIKTQISDGMSCKKGDVLMTVSGSAASILASERVALNFAGRLSGIATKTAQFVDKTKGTNARVTCTRKTTPGLRLVEKLAVLHGGGSNHRFSLSDAIMIKDNHISAAGGVRPALEAVKAHASHMMAVEIEVDRLDQLSEVLEIGIANVVLLDNMDIDMLQKAVKIVDGRMKTEASGNITLERICSVAATGVDYISSGSLTHSAASIDLGLDFD